MVTTSSPLTNNKSLIVKSLHSLPSFDIIHIALSNRPISEMDCIQQTFRTILSHSSTFQHRSIDTFMIRFEGQNEANIIERIENPTNPLFAQCNPTPILNEANLGWAVYENGLVPAFSAQLEQCKLTGINYPNHGFIKAEPVILLRWRWGKKVKVSARMKIVDTREGRVLHQGVVNAIVHCHFGGVAQFEESIILENVDGDHREAQAGYNQVVFDVLFQEVLEQDVQLSPALFNKALTF